LRSSWIQPAVYYKACKRRNESQISDRSRSPEILWIENLYLIRNDLVSQNPLTSHRSPRKKVRWRSLGISHLTTWIFPILSSIKHFILAKHAPFRAPYQIFFYLGLRLPTHPTSPQLHLQIQTSSRLSPLLLFHVSPHRNSPLIGSYWTSSHIWISNFSVVIDWIYMFL
jgi:hypothetical protein